MENVQLKKDQNNCYKQNYCEATYFGVEMMNLGHVVQIHVVL